MPKKEPRKTADDPEILFPDIEIQVTDPDTKKPVTVTVREMRFLESLRAQPIAKSLIRSLASVTLGDADVDASEIDAVIGEHADIWIKILSIATARPTAWLERLSARDSYDLSLAQWNANGFFFITRAMTQVNASSQVSESFRSLKSSTSSSAPATAPARQKSPNGTHGGRSSGSGTSRATAE